MEYTRHLRGACDVAIPKKKNKGAGAVHWWSEEVALAKIQANSARRDMRGAGEGEGTNRHDENHMVGRN